MREREKEREIKREREDERERERERDRLNQSVHQRVMILKCGDSANLQIFCRTEKKTLLRVQFGDRKVS